MKVPFGSVPGVSDQMLKYIRGIKNSQKREYAVRYAIWLMRSENKNQTMEPTPFNCSYIAAQAVRMRLETLKSQLTVNRFAP